MILQALNAYYERLPNATPFGFSPERISFCLVLDLKGRLRSVEDLRSLNGKKAMPRMMIVPYRGKRASGVQANFLWDNTGYVLGLDQKGKPDRTQQTFDAFRQFQDEVAQACDSHCLAAVLKFLKQWDPDHPDSKVSAEKDLLDSNVVFRIDGEHQYIHEVPEVRSAWLRWVSADSTESQRRGLCLVTGREAPIATLHPAIKGVWGAQTTGAALVSFNLKAFTSYGKDQNHNAPVSEAVAFQYTTALNSLLADPKHRGHVADMSLVWWTEAPTEIEDLFGNLLDTRGVAEDEQLRGRLTSFIERLRHLSKPTELEGASVPFYILGLSPNAARVAVRVWEVSTAGDLAGRLGQHFNDMEICGARPNELQPSLFLVLRETARDADGIPPLLGGAVLRAVLSGSPYPDALFAAVMRRISADGRMSYARAAIIKAWLQRKIRLSSGRKEITVSLDSNRVDSPYLLGRLFAILERVQESASGGSLNRTIKDAYFSSAATTPAAVFPRLLRLSHHHQKKLSNGMAIYFNRLIQEVHTPLDKYPLQLGLEEQGLFYIGYYHQRQDFFTAKQAEPQEA